jgi:signal transduction histidine kinase
MRDGRVSRAAQAGRIPPHDQPRDGVPPQPAGRARAHLRRQRGPDRPGRNPRPLAAAARPADGGAAADRAGVARFDRPAFHRRRFRPVAEACPSAVTTELAEARRALDAAKRDIRVQTFLLHPPRIESHGLAEAITAFASGFGTRAGLAVVTRIDPVADELDDEAALSLFRICQEALANIHRHARAARAAVTLECGAGRIVLTIADDGIGVDEAVRARALESGVGLSSMRERMRRLGGSLALLPGEPGTKVVATLPWHGEGRPVFGADPALTI